MHNFQNYKANDDAYKKLCNGIMSSIPSSVLIVDEQLKVILANRNFYVKSKRSESNTVGRSISEIFPKVLVEYTGMTEKIKSVFKFGEPDDGGEMEYRAPGLPTRVYYYRLTPLINSLSKVENVILLMDDVSERKRLGERVRRAEEHLARVVESANDIIISIDPEGKIISWNGTIERITGHKSVDVKGLFISNILAVSDSDSFASKIKGLLKKKKFSVWESSILNKDGETVDVSWSFSAIKDEQGNVIGIVIIGRDLTERKILEAKLTQSAKMASLGIMAGGVAHEIRNPLAIIDSCAQILNTQANDKKIRGLAVEKIRNATKRATEIVNNLLKFARQSEFALELLDIHQVIDNALSLMKNQLSIQHVKLETNYGFNLPKIHGNMNQLQQVFMNLILNTCNAIKEQGLLRIQTQCIDQVISINFTDNGIGIPEKNLSIIFDPFFTTQPVGKGTGLGLSISYGIIRQHGGNIEVESEPGKGATFSIKLPVYRKSSDK
ncbi:MAG: PAS domain S-box protein [bacterium]